MLVSITFVGAGGHQKPELGKTCWKGVQAGAAYGGAEDLSRSGSTLPWAGDVGGEGAENGLDLERRQFRVLAQ